jgi:hypothetical protein
MTSINLDMDAHVGGHVRRPGRTLQTRERLQQQVQQSRWLTRPGRGADREPIDLNVQ